MPIAPDDALIENTFFQTGEWVAANQPVVSLLPDSQIKVRFFAPEKKSAYRPRPTGTLRLRRLPGGLTAKITYVGPRPEFTPPVIYTPARDRSWCSWSRRGPD